MKKSLIAGAVLGAFAGAAHAEDQKSLTVYGVVDAALRSTTNVNPVTGAGYTGFSQGLFNGSRVGFKGEEQLDNGMKAIYTAEAGFTIGTGAGDQQGQLFGRQAWAGLSHDAYGALTFGRQYGNFSDAIGTGDVFGEKHGNLVYASNNGSANFPNQGDTVSENGFMYQEMGYRWDNSILYANKVGSVKFSAMHSFSGQTAASSSAANNTVGGPAVTVPNPSGTTTNSLTSGNKATMNSVALGYVSNTFNATVGYQLERDANNKQHRDSGFGVNYMFAEKSGVYLSYMLSNYDAGFTRIGLGTNSEISAAPTAAQRTDRIATLSANDYVTDKLNLIVAVYHDSASNVATAGDTGSRMGELVTADYYMSKNTDTYLMVAHTHFTSALVNNGNGGNVVTGTTAGYVAPNASNVNTVMVGLRHRF